MSQLYDSIEYSKTILYTGFLKSASSVTFISLAITLFSQQRYEWGLMAFMGGILAIYFSDIYKMKRKEKEMSEIEKTIDAKAHEIARVIVESEQKKMNKRVEERIEQIEDAVCNDNKQFCND